MRVGYRVHALGEMREVEVAPADFETRSECPICRSRALTDVSVLEGSLTSAWCRDCLHLFHRVRPSQRWFDDWYSRNWDVGADGAARHGTRRALLRAAASVLPSRLVAKALTLRAKGGYDRRAVFHFCEPVLPPRGRVLDIGCGYGGQLMPFRASGRECFGIEASPHRAAHCRALGIRAVNVPVERLDVGALGGQMDLVTSNHVLEHVADPHEFMRGITRVLRPGGWVCVTVPNVARDLLLQTFFFALHIHCFSRSSLIALLRSHGFEVHRVLEEHQIRVLARQVEKTETDGEFRSEGPTEPSQSWILRATLGGGFESYENKPLFCNWGPVSPALGRPYDVAYSGARDERFERGVELVWSGPKSLPVEFSRLDGGSRAPLWAK